MGDVAGEQVHFRRLQETEAPPFRCRITLGQAVAKGKNMDLIVQKSVEIGAAEIAPLISERTIVDLDAKEAEQKRTKWQQIAIEAAKQCGQNWLPTVHGPLKLKDFFASVEASASPARIVSPAAHSRSEPGRLPPQFDLRLIGSLQPDAIHLKRILSDYVEQHRDRPKNVLMLVGPEGDFTPA